MSARTIIRLISILFILIGLMMSQLATQDPAPRSGWGTFDGVLKEVAFREGVKLGRVATLTLDGAEDEGAFMLTHVNKLPEVERQLRALQPGMAVEIQAVPREAAGWAAPEGQPLAMLVLRHEANVIYDRDRDDGGGRWLAIALSIAGYAFSGLFLVILLLTFRKGTKGS